MHDQHESGEATSEDQGTVSESSATEETPSPAPGGSTTQESEQSGATQKGIMDRLRSFFGRK